MYGLWLLTQLRSSRSRAAAKLSQGGPSILSREVLLYSICPLSFFPRSAHSPFVLSPTSTGGAKVGGHVLFSASAYSLAWTRARADLLSAVVGEGGGLNGVTASDEHDGTPWTAKRARHAWGGREGGGGLCFRSGWWWLSLPSPCISSLRRVNWDISYITHSLPLPCLYWYMCMFIWVGDIYTYIYISLLLYGVGSSYSPCLQTVWDIDRRVSGTVPKPIAIAHRPSPSPTPPPSTQGPPAPSLVLAPLLNLS